MYEDMMKEVNNLEMEITDLKEANKDLRDYVEILERNEALKCQEKSVNDLGTKQKGRKLQLLKNKAQCALWFCKSFGLDLTNIRLQDESGCNYNWNIPFHPPWVAIKWNLKSCPMTKRKLLSVCYSFSISFVWGTRFITNSQLQSKDCQNRI